ncbi:MAG: triacylglycerol lipase [Polyangiaceae bacterium]
MRRWGFLALGMAAAAGPVAVGACANDTPETDDDIYVTTGVGGAPTTTNTGGAGGRHSTGVWGSGGGGGGTVEGSGPPYPIVLAHGFFGFDEFAGVDFATYFYGVKDDLAEHGELQVYTPAVDPFNDSTTRGAELWAYIDGVLAETGAAKVIIIGHSQGGLDARVVAHDHPDKVAAVVTVATPHQGSPVSDVVLGIVSDPNAQNLADDIVQLIGAPLWDAAGDQTSVVKALAQFSTDGIAEFNATYPDVPGVFYASVTGRTDYSLGGQDCVSPKPLPYVKELETERDPTEVLFLVSEGLCDGPTGSDPNDGLVRVKDAKHGEFWGCVPADHTDEIGQIFGDNPGLGNPFDHKRLYRDLVTRLRERGY